MFTARYYEVNLTPDGPYPTEMVAERTNNDNRLIYGTWRIFVRFRDGTPTRAFGTDSIAQVRGFAVETINRVETEPIAEAITAAAQAHRLREV